MCFDFNIIIIGMLFLISRVVSADVYNVKDYGAVGDGQTDSTKAFQDAWSASCAVEGNPSIVIPKGSYLVGPLVFKGPCKGIMEVQLQGQVLASTNLNAFTSDWIRFRYVNGLTILGGGSFNGQGGLAWPHNECRKNKGCKLLPISVRFDFVTNAIISGVSSIDSKFYHFNIFSSKDIKLDSINISAPGNSPNTDGIHISDSANVEVVNIMIATGDDCISIGAGNTNVTISNVFCGPGHGISVGSLGKHADERDVLHLMVRNCTLTSTTNGVRIKTWQSTAAPLTVTGFIFEDIIMNNVSNPIIIDQKYCPNRSCAGMTPSLVQIKNVKFKHIRGTSATLEAIKLICSDKFHCEGVELSDINLVYIGEERHKSVTSTCVNVHGNSNDNVFPSSCI